MKVEEAIIRIIGGIVIGMAVGFGIIVGATLNYSLFATGLGVMIFWLLISTLIGNDLRQQFLIVFIIGIGIAVLQQCFHAP